MWDLGAMDVGRDEVRKGRILSCVEKGERAGARLNWAEGIEAIDMMNVMEC